MRPFAQQTPPTKGGLLILLLILQNSHAASSLAWLQSCIAKRCWLSG